MEGREGGREGGLWTYLLAGSKRNTINSLLGDGLPVLGGCAEVIVRIGYVRVL